MKFMCTQSIMKTNMILKTHYSSMSTDSGYTTHPQQPPLKKGLKRNSFLLKLKKTLKIRNKSRLLKKILNPLTPAVLAPANVSVIKMHKLEPFDTHFRNGHSLEASSKRNWNYTYDYYGFQARSSAYEHNCKPWSLLIQHFFLWFTSFERIGRGIKIDATLISWDSSNSALIKNCKKLCIVQTKK